MSNPTLLSMGEDKPQQEEVKTAIKESMFWLTGSVVCCVPCDLPLCHWLRSYRRVIGL